MWSQELLAKLRTLVKLFGSNTQQTANICLQICFQICLMSSLPHIHIHCCFKCVTPHSFLTGTLWCFTQYHTGAPRGTVA